MRQLVLSYVSFGAVGIPIPVSCYGAHDDICQLYFVDHVCLGTGFYCMNRMARTHMLPISM